MKRLFAFALVASLLACVSCTERTYIEFTQTQKECSSAAQTFVLETNLPIQFIGVALDDNKSYLDCSYPDSNAVMTCDGGWFNVSCKYNSEHKVTVTLNENFSSKDRKISVQALYNGVATTCTLIQSGSNNQ